MSIPQPQSQNTLLEKFGVACGFVCAFLYTLSVYDATYDVFYRFALSRASHDDIWLWDSLYMVSLFFLIVTLVAFALNMIISVIKGFFITLIVLFTKLRR